PLMCSRYILVTCYLYYFSLYPPPPRSTLFPYTRSSDLVRMLERRQQSSVLSVAHLCRAVRRRRQKIFSVRTENIFCRRRRTARQDRKSTRLNSSHLVISYAVFCLKKKNHNLLCFQTRLC